MTNIPKAVFDYFAADPTGPLWKVGSVADDPSSAIYSEVEELLSRIDLGEVAQTRDGAEFQHLARNNKNPDREARIWIAERLLFRSIASRRIDALRDNARRPSPYDQPALVDLAPDEEGLVPLREFEFDGSRLLRNGHAFLVLSTTPLPNSTYWLLQSCYSQNLQQSVRVRLDPFLHGPAESFPAMSYRMLVYGQPLDWHRLNNLREPEHGRWRPDVFKDNHEFTDYAWSPRGPEVHFVCEEVPAVERSSTNGGRYSHAVYLPSEGALSHLDCALRIYSDSEVAARREQHVRNTGKVGLRRKVFRIDSLVPRSVLSSVCQSFFVWNQDVSRYFDGGCVSDSSGESPTEMTARPPPSPRGRKNWSS